MTGKCVWLFIRVIYGLELEYDFSSYLSSGSILLVSGASFSTGLSLLLASSLDCSFFALYSARCTLYSILSSLVYELG